MISAVFGIRRWVGAWGIVASSVWTMVITGF
jgi:hypothetical protein